MGKPFTNIVSFWDTVHNTKNNNWIANSNPVKVFELYKISPPVGKTVLDIGVGSGSMAKYLFSLKNKVICVDIYSTALSKIHLPVVKLLIGDLQKSPKVDMAIMHLVIQHCEDKMVKFLLNNIPLNGGGAIYMQSCGEEGKEISTDLDMLYFRSYPYLSALIDATNKQIIEHYSILGKKYSRSPRKKLYWDIMTLTNREGK